MPDDTPRKENLLTRKIGPLPTWAWTAIVGGAVILWALYQRSRQSQAQAAASSATAPDTVPPVVTQDYDTTNVNLTTPPDQDDDRIQAGHRPKEPGPYPRPPKHHHIPGPATHHKVHRAHPPHGDHDADDRTPRVFPTRTVEPRPGPALQGR